MKRFLKVRGASYALSLAVAGLLPSMAYADSLLEVYELARENDPQFQADFYGKQATDERYYQARAALLPQVSLNARQSEIAQDIVSSDNDVFGSGSTDYPTTVYGASIDQSIYDYSRWAAFDKAKLEIKQAASELEIARQDLFLRVAERYFTALALHENLTFLRAEKASVEASLEDVRVRREQGLVREIELLDAQARYLQVQARELDVVNRLRDALNALAEVTGEFPEELKVIGDQLTLESPDPASMEAWQSIARERSPRLKASSLARDVAMQDVKVRQGGHYPTLDLSINYDSNETEGSLFGGGSEVETQDISVALNVPVYSGGLVSSQVREGEQLINLSEARLDQVRREVNRTVQSSYQGIVTAIARTRALRESLRANLRIVETRQVGYDSGITPLLDLLDAERDLFFARSELASARYDYLMSVLRLKHAAGVLSVDDLARIDNLMGDSVDVLALASR